MRRLIFLLAALLLGLATTVAVAWVYSYLAVVRDNPGDSLPISGGFHSVQWKESESRWGFGLHERNFVGVTYLMYYQGGGEVTAPWSSVPIWARSLLSDFLVVLPYPPSDPFYTKNNSNILVGAGWPCRALWCRAAPLDFTAFAATPSGPFEYAGPGVDSVLEGGWSWQLAQNKASLNNIRSGPRIRGIISVPIPYRPYWPGLALNTLLFTIAWLLILLPLFAAPGFLRRRYRRRRGLCLRCGYHRAGLAPDASCPECGAPTATDVAPQAVK